MDKLKVAFNILPLKSGHKFRGFGYYTKNLLENLKNQPNLEIKEFSSIDEIIDADIVHYPFFDLFHRSLPLRKKFPTLVTIADVTPLIFSKHYPSGIKGGIRFQFQKLALRNTDGIITISNTSKKDIEKYLGVSENKVFSIYLAVSKNFKKIADSKRLNSLKEKYDLPDNFALFVGSTNWNKNLLNMAKACIKANIDMCIIGKSFEQRDDLRHPELKSYKEFLDLFKNNPKIHIMGFIEDEEIVEFYNSASVLLLPSFYEGFGMTILEGQSCGIPVVTSNISSMPEVAGEGAILVDPNSPEDIARGINDALKDRISLVKAGFENVKRFSWKKTAEETARVYHQVAGK